jgi:hypothetical protein
MNIEERLEVVERELAELKATQAQRIGKVIRAKRFIVEDENGKTRAELSINKDGPSLSLFDKNGNPRALLSAIKDGPRLELFDENGTPRAGLSALKDGPMLSLFDENGKPRSIQT